MNYTHHIMTEDLKNNTNYARLRELYAMLEGVPEKAIELDTWANTKVAFGDREFLSGDKTPEQCGAIACAVGWAGMYPPFKELGFVLSGLSPVLMTKAGQQLEKAGGWVAVCYFFGISTRESRGLLLKRPDIDELHAIGMKRVEDVGTDKQRALRRIARFLCYKGVITKQREDELAVLRAQSRVTM